MEFDLWGRGMGERAWGATWGEGGCYEKMAAGDVRHVIGTLFAMFYGQLRDSALYE